ncbi:hypothetical protein BDA96_10G227500 [Sorghum bicolor]|uniref:Uncharacterized protein n=2 Tax=Sorghum bicolor TaxID=4558 RepID=A0A921Q620_SORBI|nr:hypothetical protein BDA96_10G227500 [Sorghum bicolor]OQU76601.1 hypothetical protein SORBI_3010G172666 [Sorghum bicolor]
MLDPASLATRSGGASTHHAWEMEMGGGRGGRHGGSTLPDREEEAHHRDKAVACHGRWRKRRPLWWIWPLRLLIWRI